MMGLFRKLKDNYGLMLYLILNISILTFHLKYLLKYLNGGYIRENYSVIIFVIISSIILILAVIIYFFETKKIFSSFLLLFFIYLHYHYLSALYEGYIYKGIAIAGVSLLLSFFLIIRNIRIRDNNQDVLE